MLLISILIIISTSNALTLRQKLGNEYIDTTVEYKDRINMKFNSKIGYQFNKWIVEKGNINVEDLESEEISFSMPNKDVTIRADYDSTYKITFVAEDGNMNPIEIPAGGSRKLPLNSIVNEGNEFLGWSTRTDGEVEYVDEEVITPTKNMTLYAKYEKYIPILAAQELWYTQGGTSIPKSSITSIEIKDSGKPTTYHSRWDASAEKNGSVYAYLEESGVDTYKLSLVGNGYGKIYGNSDCSNAFRDFTNATSITGFVTGEFIYDTSQVTDMSYMFRGCNNLASLNLSSFNTQNVTNFTYTFEGCKKLTELNLSSFNTSKAIDLHRMFQNCSGLLTLTLDPVKFNTSNATSMYGMFYGCSKLTSVDISKFDTGKATSLLEMFYGCNSLANIDVSNFNTANVTNMKYMFYGCKSLVELNASNFNTSNVTDMGGMFWFCNSLKKLNISGFDTSAIEESKRIKRTASTGATYYEYYGLAYFASRCDVLNEIILGANFGQTKNIVGGGTDVGLFYAAYDIDTKVTNMNSEMYGYDWGADRRTLIN